MFGRNASFAAAVLALTLLLPSPAHARKQNFATGFPFGVGLVGGLEGRPQSGFAAGTQTSSGTYTRYFSVEPFFDFINLVVKARFGWHFYPVLNGSGIVSKGTFTESSEAGSFDYGVKVMLCPFLSHDLENRFYLTAGYGLSTIKVKNTRTYSAGTLANNTLSERLEGHATELSGGMGVEFFLLQNYSLQLEGGYTSRSANSFAFKSSTDVIGKTRTDGEEALSLSNLPRGFHLWTPYAQVAFSLNL